MTYPPLYPLTQGPVSLPDPVAMQRHPLASGPIDPMPICTQNN